MNKKDFPIFKNNPELVYLDNASTTQKPKQVINSVKEFYETSNANIHRGIYDLSVKATKKYENARKEVAKFINANHKEIIFTSGTTESINFLSYTVDSIIKKEKNEILLTEMEHHSNLVPWQQLAKRKGMKLRFIKVKRNFTLDMEDAKNKITDKTAIISLAHVSNTLGTINPVKEIIGIAKKKSKDIITIVDAAQGVGHMKINVRSMGCDFLAFSGHKIYGPFGVGVLYGKKELLARILPFQFGGDMIKSVSFENAEWNAIPERFEAGTQNVAGAGAFGEAIKYIEKIGIEKINNYEEQITMYALDKLSNVKGMELYSPPYKISSIISFNLKGIPSHDVASLLDDYKICIRAGHHCTMPLMKTLKIKQNGTARASFSFYNTKEDVDKLAEALNKINKRFNEK